MNLTLPELSERLKQLDEITLLELLNISSEDIIDRFDDIIEAKADILTKQVDWDY